MDFITGLFLGGLFGFIGGLFAMIKENDRLRRAIEARCDICLDDLETARIMRAADEASDKGQMGQTIAAAIRVKE